jgi:DNA integrity scanning protein DisA with diadenylate cyclase activity
MINKRTVESTIVLAIEIAREGREGKMVGTLFAVSDSDRTIWKLVHYIMPFNPDFVHSLP